MSPYFIGLASGKSNPSHHFSSLFDEPKNEKTLKENKDNKLELSKGRGGGQMVSELYNPSLNPAESLQFFLQNLSLKRTKINEKRPGLAI